MEGMDWQTLIIAKVALGFGLYVLLSVGAYYSIAWFQNRG